MNLFLYRVAMWASIHRVDWLHGLIYRYRCPHPINHFSPRDCFNAGECGCDNAARYQPDTRRNDHGRA